MLTLKLMKLEKSKSISLQGRKDGQILRAVPRAILHSLIFDTAEMEPAQLVSRLRWREGT